MFNISPTGRVSLRDKPAKNELRISRLTYNTNNWEFPSGYEGKSKTKSYEKSNGFGHEEWLFDFTKTIDGYHYGFLEPINKHHNKYAGSIYDILLFTVNSQTKERFWIGKINNAEIIDGELSQEIKEEYIKRGWYQEMKRQLGDWHLDGNKLDEWNSLSLFNVRFRPEDFVPFPDYTYVDKDDKTISTYHYTLMHVKKDPEILSKLEEGFQLGKGAGRGRRKGKTVKRYQTEKLIEHPFIHDEISIQLEANLKRQYPEVYHEHPSGFGGNIDLVVHDGKKNIYFYEIKTYNDVRTCIRVALGQLMDYAYFPNVQTAKRLYIMTQHFIKDKRLVDYIKHLRSVTSLPLHYIAYSIDQKRILQEI